MWKMAVSAERKITKFNILVCCCQLVPVFCTQAQDRRELLCCAGDIAELRQASPVPLQSGCQILQLLSLDDCTCQQHWEMIRYSW